MGAMADEFRRQLELPCMDSLSFEERVAMLAEAEWSSKESAKAARLASAAKLRYPSARFADVDFRATRGLEKSSIARLSDFSWMRNHRNMIITGCAGTGKTWLASAFGAEACTRAFSVLYFRATDLTDELLRASSSGALDKTLAKLNKTNLLIIDDWCSYAVSTQEGKLLLDVFEGRCERSSVIIASQIPVASWHSMFNDGRTADSILDRVIHNSHRFDLKGSSLRQVESLQ
jgi:DNA replication protein DnaC